MTNQQDTPIKGIFYLIGGVFVFSTQDVLIKYLSSGYPLFEIMFIRSLAAVVPCLVIVHFDSGLGSLKTKRMGAHIVRSALMFLSYSFYYLGIAVIPLADAVALFYTSPFFVVILSILFFKEQITVKRWISLITCFTGVLIILHPGSGTMVTAAIFPILSALTYALSVLMIRRVAGSESASTLGFSLVIFSIFISGGLGLFMGKGLAISNSSLNLDFLTRAWIYPSTKDMGIMIGIGIFVSIGFYSLTQAYCVAKSSTIAPFEYTGMLPAVMWGFFLWNETPSFGSLTGILIILTSGIYLIRLETRNRGT
ncbi:DMT family transporter [Desulfocicer vacuolatum]|nr:DMT family transporter [Desulfocicer vacuolatum]